MSSTTKSLLTLTWNFAIKVSVVFVLSSNNRFPGARLYIYEHSLENELAFLREIAFLYILCQSVAWTDAH